MNPWFAEVWLNRNQFWAYGDTEEDAKTKLLNHMRGMAGVWEEKIKIEQRTLADIRKLLNDYKDTTT